MKIISHRGNVTGPDPSMENTVEHINQARARGFIVEADVWGVDGVLYLGHDEPIVAIPNFFMNDRDIWLHAKNLEAIELIHSLDLENIWFWHEEDQYTLTSHGVLWTYPGSELSRYSIAVLPEQHTKGKWWNCYGVCTDFPVMYESMIATAHSHMESLKL